MASAENIQKVIDYLDTTKTFFLATEDGDQPKVRPFGFKMVADGRIYFGAGTFKDVYRQLRTNPKVEICATDGKGFLRYYGTAVFDDRPELFEQACAEAPYLPKMYNEETGRVLAMFYLADATAEFRSLFAIEESLDMR
ncbi:pyridoxamine 5'-phosphate oxidase family protein [Curtanaerobium respiraculi]|uniref:pyridoxamine 5'-phosphate oxidase family protein n=1 Tax=Curtanaerobium respiraculi TaxID=2949669 RepID=UPI0024B34D16|nr:pyridoxamine 5'-phosphate oxidase family protein [Curtanaerobium respiraculi]